MYDGWMNKYMDEPIVIFCIHDGWMDRHFMYVCMYTPEQKKKRKSLLMVLTNLITNHWSGNQQELHKSVDKVT